ncbi:uncharacterized protein METZ01_LOCUS218626, partial [marine metagenome]
MAIPWPSIANHRSNSFCPNLLNLITPSDSLPRKNSKAHTHMVPGLAFINSICAAIFSGCQQSSASRKAIMSPLAAAI